MQNGNHKNLPKRTRYYQGMIDLNLLDKGMDYTQLKQSFVIFVCTFDPFHIGRHVYTFENRCVEDPNLPLNDGTQKIILNTKGIFDDVRPELKRLLNFIDGRQPEDSFTQDLSKAVESAKRNEKWRHDYMTLQMAYDEKYREGLETGIQQGIERGIEQGIEQGITTSARRMLSSGKYSDSEITGLSVEQIQALKNSAKYTLIIFNSILYNSRIILRLLSCTLASTLPSRARTRALTTASPTPVLPSCREVSPV